LREDGWSGLCWTGLGGVCVCLYCTVLYIDAGLVRAGRGWSILLVHGNNKFNFILDHQVMHVSVRESCKYGLHISLLYTSVY
jgi:hypothetical protein